MSKIAQKITKGGRGSGSVREELPCYLVQRSCPEMVEAMTENCWGKNPPV